MAGVQVFVGKKEGTGIYIFDITNFFIFFTHCNVHHPECNIHDRGMTLLRTFINWATCDVA